MKARAQLCVKSSGFLRQTPLLIHRGRQGFVGFVVVRWNLDVCLTVLVLLSDHGQHVRSTLAWRTYLDKAELPKLPATQCPMANVVYISSQPDGGIYTLTPPNVRNHRFPESSPSLSVTKLGRPRLSDLSNLGGVLYCPPGHVRRCCSQGTLVVFAGHQVCRTPIISGNSRRSLKLHKLGRVLVCHRRLFWETHVVLRQLHFQVGHQPTSGSPVRCTPVHLWSETGSSLR